MSSYQHVKLPAGGTKITVNPDYSLTVPDNPIIPYIEGDGTGRLATQCGGNHRATHLEHIGTTGGIGKNIHQPCRIDVQRFAQG